MGDARDTSKAPDAFRTISEVAEDLDLPQHVLRFWETRFAQIRPVKRGGGRRFYRPEDVDLLRGIRHLLYSDGYTIKGVQKILKEHGVRHVQDLGVERDVAVMRSARAPAGDGVTFGGLLGLLPRRRPRPGATDEPVAMEELPLPFPDPEADRESGRETAPLDIPLRHRPSAAARPRPADGAEAAPRLDPSFAPPRGAARSAPRPPAPEAPAPQRPTRGPAARIAAPQAPGEPRAAPPETFEDPLLPFFDDVPLAPGGLSEPLEARIRRLKGDIAAEAEGRRMRPRPEEGPQRRGRPRAAPEAAPPEAFGAEYPGPYAHGPEYFGREASGPPYPGREDARPEDLRSAAFGPQHPAPGSDPAFEDEPLARPRPRQAPADPDREPRALAARRAAPDPRMSWQDLEAQDGAPRGGPSRHAQPPAHDPRARDARHRERAEWDRLPTPPGAAAPGGFGPDMATPDHAVPGRHERLPRDAAPYRPARPGEASRAEPRHDEPFRAEPFHAEPVRAEPWGRAPAASPLPRGGNAPHFEPSDPLERHAPLARPRAPDEGFPPDAGVPGRWPGRMDEETTRPRRVVPRFGPFAGPAEEIEAPAPWPLPPAPWRGHDPFDAPDEESHHRPGPPEPLRHGPPEQYLPPHLRAEPRVTGQPPGAAPVLSRADVRRLQAALYELSECRRLMGEAMGREKERGATGASGQSEAPPA